MGYHQPLKCLCVKIKYYSSSGHIVFHNVKYDNAFTNPEHIEYRI